MKVAQKPSVIGSVQRELTAYATHRINENLKVRGYMLKGFAYGSPDGGIVILVSSDL